LSLEHQASTFRVVKAIEKPIPQSAPKVLPPPIPAPVTTISQQDVRAFLTEHHTKASKGDLVGMIADYDTMVDFLDKGILPREAIMADERTHRAKWSAGHEKIVGDIRLTQDGENWHAEYMIEFYNESATGEWQRGQADLALRLKQEHRSLLITSQKANVHDVTNSSQAPKKSEPEPEVPKQPKGVPISVPKPCFVAITQAKDVRQIEFTDQISFVNGITWHRTFREISPEGKVTNICRATYEGSGGVHPNRQTARIYVGVQGWQRGMGAPTFVRLCEGSAAALVGREFIFQFTQNGMIELNTGTSFKLVK
jgi:hypothetical protein